MKYSTKVIIKQLLPYLTLGAGSVAWVFLRSVYGQPTAIEMFACGSIFGSILGFILDTIDDLKVIRRLEGSAKD